MNAILRIRNVPKETITLINVYAAKNNITRGEAIKKLVEIAIKNGSSS